MIGKLTTEEVNNVLRSQIVGRIGCHAEGLTYVVPVSYANDGEWVYVHTFEGMKLQMMRKNPHVCFEVEDMHNMGYWKSVICWGRFEELTDTELVRRAKRLLTHRPFPMESSQMTHLSDTWPFESEQSVPVEGVYFRIHLEKATGRYETNSVHLAHAHRLGP